MGIQIVKIVHYSSTIRYTIKSDYYLKIKNWMIQAELSPNKKTLSFFIPKGCENSRMYFHEYMEFDLNEEEVPRFDPPDVVVKHK